MEALTTKIDSQFKDIKGEIKEMRDGCNSCGAPHLSSKFNPNAKPTVIQDDSEDEADEAEIEVEPSSSKQTKFDPPQFRINVPLVDVLAGMPNYEKFLKDLVRNKSNMEQISAAFLNNECSAIIQNKLLPKLGDLGSFLIPCTVAGSVEYLALADLGASINKINESSLDEEFMTVDVKEIPEQKEEIKDTFKELPLQENLRIKTFIQDPPTGLELKPLPKHLEYAFLEKDSLLPVVISALLKDDEKKSLVSILKRHKEAFS
nr:reverse transcriptase domain-containing protein [Tanacetum cinerariifolium]